VDHQLRNTGLKVETVNITQVCLNVRMHGKKITEEYNLPFVLFCCCMNGLSLFLIDCFHMYKMLKAAHSSESLLQCVISVLNTGSYLLTAVVHYWFVL
jgi:hypothetical protein